MIKSSPLSITALGLVVLGALSLACCQQLGPVGRNQSSAWKGVKPLISVEGGPIYHLLDGYDKKWLEQVREGVELSRSYWGSYGPARVWILGCEDGASISAEAKDRFLSEYCAWRTATSERTISECLPHAEERFIEVAERGDPEAYLSDVRDTELRMAELIFINVHKWFSEDEPVPDPVLRGIHEYTHVFQQGFGQMPTWMMEGGAVFAEVWLPLQEWRLDPHEKMRWIMQSARKAERSGYTIADMEEIESAPKSVSRFHRELAYDSGAWAIVFMVHRSSSQSVTALRDEFYPLVTKLGWEAALSSYVDMQSKREFYEAFERFMKEPIEEQLVLFDELKP